MGVIYKIKSEVISFVLEEKKNDHSLSCRGLTSLVQHKFNIKLSKSSINFIIKNASLSMPVGRPCKRRRVKILRPANALSQDDLKGILKQPDEVKAEPAIEIMPVAAQAKPEETVIMPEAAVPLKPVEEINLPIEITGEKEKIPVGESVTEQTPVAEIPEVLPEIKPQKEILLNGLILLKAMDYLLQGSKHIAEVIKRRIKLVSGDFSLITESVIYLQLEGLANLSYERLSLAANLTGKQFSQEEINAYLDSIQTVKEINIDVFRTIVNTFEPVRCIKVVLSDGQSLYLDGQLRTVWSAAYVPYDFGTTLLAAKNYINRHFFENEPLVFYSCPGGEDLPVEFLNFLLALENQQKQIRSLTFYGNRLDELEIFTMKPQKRRLILALWPWQYSGYRKIKKTGEFRPYYFSTLNKEYFLAPIEVSLSQPHATHNVTLRGCVLQNSLSDKPRLFILSNIAPEEIKIEDLAVLYLEHWPNFEEGLQDFQRKIEFFTYTASSQQGFSAESLSLQQYVKSDTLTLFNQYLLALDAYFKRYFFPAGAENIDFPTVKEQFYSMEVHVEHKGNDLIYIFKPAQGFRYLRELKYACLRLNEREIKSCDNKSIWFQV
ncbi:MAG: hypothetical protein HY761_06800 [Candidatus Omnitrophica bacterium]|nr:hypothetical protein [Candidatus Omnitrophota bacterium]